MYTYQEIERKLKDKVSRLEEEVEGAEKAKLILESALERTKIKLDSLEGVSLSETEIEITGKKAKNKKGQSKAKLQATIELLKAEKEVMERERNALKRRCENERSDKESLEVQVERLREDYEKEIEKLKTTSIMPPTISVCNPSSFFLKKS